MKKEEERRGVEGSGEIEFMDEERSFCTTLGQFTGLPGDCISL